MDPSFLLFHTENVNEDQNSICHLILVPVIDGVRQSSKEFFFNPEAKFYFVMSGIQENDVLKFPSYSDQWPEVQQIFNKFGFCISSADGYAARSLFGTLTRLGIEFSPMDYCNAKAICRRSMNELSYSFDYLGYRFYNDTIGTENPVAIAERWADLAIKGLQMSDAASLDQFLEKAKISKGRISPDELTSSLCIRDYSNRQRNHLDTDAIPVNAQPDNDLFGKNVVFTGKLESMKRDDARTAVIEIGGFAPERLTQETDFLVVGVQDLRVVGEKGLSSKMKTAAKYKEKGLPIELIDENDFMRMLKGENLEDI